MSGDATNVATWANADVLIGDLADVTAPTLGTPFTATGGLGFLGLVTPDGFTESQSNDSNDIPAFTEAGVVATVRSNQAFTLQVVALEDNVAALGLRYDASGVTAVGGGLPGYHGPVKARDLTRKFALGLQLTTGTMLKQQFTKGRAEIDSIGDAQQSQSGALQTQITFKVYPAANKELWDTWFGAYDFDSSSSSSSSS